MMQSAISRGVSIGVLLLVPHRITIFFTDDGKGKSMTPHSTILTRSAPVLKFNAFIGAEYSFYLFFFYPLRPAKMESLSRRVLSFESLIIKQWLR